jgi:hypothetical protein
MVGWEALVTYVMVSLLLISKSDTTTISIATVDSFNSREQIHLEPSSELMLVFLNPHTIGCQKPV